MESLQMVGVSLLVLLTLRFLTQIRNGDYDGALKFVIAMVAGIGVAFLAAQTTQAETTLVSGTPLSELNGWDLTWLGLSLGAIAGGFWTLTKAIDGHQSAAQGDLVRQNGRPPHDAG